MSDELVALSLLVSLLVWGPIGFVIGRRSDRGLQGYFAAFWLGPIGIALAYAVFRTQQRQQSADRLARRVNELKPGQNIASRIRVGELIDLGDGPKEVRSVRAPSGEEFVVIEFTDGTRATFARNETVSIIGSSSDPCSPERDRSPRG